ncbi:UNVERIFIED_CONTAM: hypothetical protein Scaly_0361200 [Sesamum calycinum]|uniref:Uncharacterized protein n=1 Tax=Sesamum calycinum TaxID=2727403 RepID=A0AAW2SEE3_9LAMI
MLRLKRLIEIAPRRSVNGRNLLKEDVQIFPAIPLRSPSQWTSNRFLDIYQIGPANKIIIPAVAAVKFPTVEVNYSDGSSLKLPITSDKNDPNLSKSDVPRASLLCLSFRASSQVSFIDSWLLTRSPIKKLLLKIMRKQKLMKSKMSCKGRLFFWYIFLLDRLGRIRWQGFGLATPDELSSLLSCTSLLLEEK